jgi:hypothetical protein
MKGIAIALRTLSCVGIALASSVATAASVTVSKADGRCIFAALCLHRMFPLHGASLK